MVDTLIWGNTFLLLYVFSLLMMSELRGFIVRCVSSFCGSIDSIIQIQLLKKN